MGWCRVLESTKHVFGLDQLIEQSDVITIGIDGGGLDDLLGSAVLGRLKKILAFGGFGTMHGQIRLL